MLKEYQITSEIPFRIPDLVKKKLDVLYLKKGQIIFSEGSSPLGAYLIQKGKVKISKLGSQGKEQITGICSNQEIVGYTDLFFNSRYSTSAKAIEDTNILFISKPEFWKMLREQQNLFEDLLQQLLQDKKLAEAKLVDFAYKPVKGRLADAMICLDKKFNGNNKKHPILITRADLAGYVGTVKETVNRVLSDFRNEKLISTNGTRINILDLNGLKRISKMYD